MRRAFAWMVIGWLLASCGGSDFQAADPADAALGDDADAQTPLRDAGSDSQRNDAVPDAHGEQVVDDTTPTDVGPTEARVTEASTDAAMTDVTFDTRGDALDAPADARCDALTTFYRDRDGDGFGSTSEHVLACVAPVGDGAWVTQPGDCRDDLADVKPFTANSPDPPKYSGTGYMDPVRPQGISFDFDCDGIETADPSNMYGAAVACPSLSTNCGQIGYLPAAPARNGTGVNPLCGSTTLRICAAQGLNCVEKTAQTTAFRCR
jgi:hypothetical protein